MNTPANTAAVLPANGADLEVRPAPYTHAGANEIVVENRAVAINPLDWIKQKAGEIVFTWVRPPFTLGSDLAGVVVEVGPGVTRFAVGDRVLAHATGTDPKINLSSEGAFQTYTVVRTNMTSPIPDKISYEAAAVLPLALSTAACALFQSDQLALERPSAQPKPTGKTLLVWGGSTSVGSCAIQLAVAAGYDVVTTASPKNFDYVRRLGAQTAFDYKSATVVRDVVAALRGKPFAGALAIGAGSGRACVDVARRLDGNKFVSIASFDVSFADAPARPGLGFRFATMRQFLTFAIGLQVRARTSGVRTKFVFGSSLVFNDVGAAIYERYLPSALAEGRFVPAPEPLVAGRGLAAIQAGLDAQRAGVSASKIVVTL